MCWCADVAIVFGVVSNRQISKVTKPTLSVCQRATHRTAELAFCPLSRMNSESTSSDNCPNPIVTECVSLPSWTCWNVILCRRLRPAVTGVGARSRHCSLFCSRRQLITPWRCVNTFRRVVLYFNHLSIPRLPSAVRGLIRGTRYWFLSIIEIRFPVISCAFPMARPGPFRASVQFQRVCDATSAQHTKHNFRVSVSVFDWPVACVINSYIYRTGTHSALAQAVVSCRRRRRRRPSIKCVCLRCLPPFPEDVKKINRKNSRMVGHDERVEIRS